MSVHGNCVTDKCKTVFVASRSLGLFKSSSFVPGDNTDPEWEHLGQVMGIRQFNVDWWNPNNAQVCMDHYGQGWLRKPSSWGDDWQLVLTVDKCRIAATEQGYDLSAWSITPLWIDYQPNYNLYAIFRANLGWPDGMYIFIWSDDAGVTWHMSDRPLWGNDLARARGWASFNFSYTSSAQWGPGQIVYAAVHNAYGDQSMLLYSLDNGRTWLPRSGGSPRPQQIPGWVSNYTVPIPCVKYQPSVYYNTYRGVGAGGGFHIKRVDNFLTGAQTQRSDGNKQGWIFQRSFATWLNDYSGFTMVTAGGEQKLWWTYTLESLGGATWDYYNTGGFIDAIGGTSPGDQIVFGYQTPFSSGGQYHAVRSTENYFASVFNKGGSNTNLTYAGYGDAALESGSIPKDYGGVAWNGIKIWDGGQDRGPDDEPILGSGYPLWINAKAKELRPDPSWDRLYVMAETQWPNGSGLWNQPLMFEFLLSGYWGPRLLYNEGRLGWMASWANGTESVFSGAITYSGTLEAHVNAPYITPSGGVLIVGDFGPTEAYYKPSINNPPGLSGWIAKSNLGTRITSVEADTQIPDDLTVTTATKELYIPSGIPSGLWPWELIKSIPFRVNVQMREGFDIWVGSEQPGQANPIYYGSVLSSGILMTGGFAWEPRSNGLPPVVINDIERGE